jgi:hypothetical protein
MISLEAAFLNASLDMKFFIELSEGMQEFGFIAESEQ